MDDRAVDKRSVERQAVVDESPGFADSPQLRMHPGNLLVPGQRQIRGFAAAERHALERLIELDDRVRALGVPEHEKGMTIALGLDV
jgi:hypothetical protein